MNDKRFKIAKGVPSDFYAYILDYDGEKMYLDEVVALLNYFFEEKEKFKEENKQLRKRVERLQKQVKSLETTMNATSDYNAYLQSEVKDLEKENERLKNKLNITALELVDEAISMGKAVEISEMNYHEFLEYRKKNEKPMELQI